MEVAALDLFDNLRGANSGVPAAPPDLDGRPLGVSRNGLIAIRHDRISAASHDDDSEDWYVVTDQDWPVGSVTTSRWITGGPATTADSHVIGRSERCAVHFPLAAQVQIASLPSRPGTQTTKKFPGPLTCHASYRSSAGTTTAAPLAKARCNVASASAFAVARASG